MQDALIMPYGYAWKLTETIDELCKHNRECALKLERFIPKQIWTETDRHEVLNALSYLFLLEDCVVDLCIRLGPLILEVVSRVKLSLLQEEHSKKQRLLKKMAVVMCKGFLISSVLKTFALDFVQMYNPFTFDTSDDIVSPLREDENQISDVDLCHAVWCYLLYIPETKYLLGVPHLHRFLSSTDSLVRWYASYAWCIYYYMSPSGADSFRNQILTKEEQIGFSIRDDMEMSALQERVRNTQGVAKLERVDTSQSDMLQIITADDLSYYMGGGLGFSFSKLSI